MTAFSDDTRVYVQSNFFWTPWRMVAAWILIELALVAVLLQLEPTIGARARVAIVALLLAGPLGLLLVLHRVLFWQAGSVARRVTAKRPGSVIVPVAVVALSRAAGRDLGLPLTGAGTPSGSPGAVLALHGRLELWTGRGQAPRWSVPLSELSITVGSATVGRSTWNVVQMADGTLSVAVAPRYTAISHHERKDIDRLLCELGQDPDSLRGSGPVMD